MKPAQTILLTFLLAPPSACTALRSGATILVAPPTGDPMRDRAAIVAAFDRARPDDTIRFAAGTYEVGPIVRVATPGLTLQGHPDGTTLRGGDGHDADWELGDGVEAIDALGVLHLFEGGCTVRGLTFADSFWGLIVGWHYGLAWDERIPDTQGGFAIEGNTFRHMRNGVRATTNGAAPTVIRGNLFVDVHQGISGLGSGYVVEQNRFAPSGGNEAPALDTAIAFGGEHVVGACSDNRVLGNTIHGYATGVVMYVDGSRIGTGNVVRDNRIVVRGDTTPSIGVELFRRPEQDSEVPPTGGLIGTVLEHNHLVGAATAGISVGAGCDDTIVRDNTFADLRGPAIVLEGERAHVTGHAPDIEVRVVGSRDDRPSEPRKNPD